ncbi:MAG: hypothetical protein NTY88_01455 [Bacteroidetes bacterium]|nr:hypothetical protein [Bacteroidota bacterium]
MWSQIFERYLQHFGWDLVRYFLFAGIPYTIIYVLLKSQLFRFKIQQKFPEFYHMRREILFSLSSMLIFTFAGTCVFIFQKMDTHKFTPTFISIPLPILFFLFLLSSSFTMLISIGVTALCT